MDNEPTGDKIEHLSPSDFMQRVQCCGNCAYYRRSKTTTTTTAHDGTRRVSGSSHAFCRRNPPTLHEGRTVWPEPKFSDWCGEYLLAAGYGGEIEPEPPPRQPIGFLPG